MTYIELEKTYLVKYLPRDLDKSPAVLIEDIYFPTNSVRSRLRLRQKGDKYEITKKSQLVDGDASKQNEETILLSKEEFELFKPLADGYVTKTRYFYEYEKTTIEIDEFDGKLKGLVMAEVEFKSEEEYKVFEQPEFCLADVTQDKYIAGSNLASMTYEDLIGAMSKYGYERIEK